MTFAEHFGSFPDLPIEGMIIFEETSCNEKGIFLYSYYYFPGNLLQKQAWI